VSAPPGSDDLCAACKRSHKKREPLTWCSNCSLRKTLVAELQAHGRGDVAEGSAVQTRTTRVSALPSTSARPQAATDGDVEAKPQARASEPLRLDELRPDEPETLIVSDADIAVVIVTFAALTAGSPRPRLLIEALDIRGVPLVGVDECHA